MNDPDIITVDIPKVWWSVREATSSPPPWVAVEAQSPEQAARRFHSYTGATRVEVQEVGHFSIVTRVEVVPL